jgi:hypothetical protein
MLELDTTIGHGRWQAPNLRVLYTPKCRTVINSNELPFCRSADPIIIVFRYPVARTVTAQQSHGHTAAFSTRIEN